MPIIDRSKPMGPSREPNPHRSAPSTDTPLQYHWKEEGPHLHTEDIQQEESLRDYALQDISVVTQKP
jgi:hypothetical protein